MTSGRFELYQLRCFVAVAEELSFRRGAERLSMTQPPLSRQIKLLEESIGLTLLERNNRSVRLTSAGNSFLISATDLLQRAEHAVLAARQAERGEMGAIAMGFVPSAGVEFVPRIVKAVNTHLPDVDFNPTEMMSYEIVEALNSGRLDIGITRMVASGSEIALQPLVSEPFVLAVPKQHRLATKRPKVSLGQLDGEPFIGFSADRGGVLRETLRGLFVVSGVMPRIVQEVSQSHTMLALVNSGIGLAIVPASTKMLRMANVIFRDLDAPDHFRSDLYVAIGPKRQSPLLARVSETILGSCAEFRDVA